MILVFLPFLILATFVIQMETEAKCGIIHLYNDGKVRFFSLLSLLYCNTFGKDRTLLLVSKNTPNVVKEVKTENTITTTLVHLFGKK